MWHSVKQPPSQERLEALVKKENTRNIPIVLINDQPKLMSRRFYPFAEIKEDAILHLDDNSLLCNEEVGTHALAGFVFSYFLRIFFLLFTSCVRACVGSSASCPAGCR